MGAHHRVKTSHRQGHRVVVASLRSHERFAHSGDQDRGSCHRGHSSGRWVAQRARAKDRVAWAQGRRVARHQRDGDQDAEEPSHRVPRPSSTEAKIAEGADAEDRASGVEASRHQGTRASRAKTPGIEHWAPRGSSAEETGARKPSVVDKGAEGQAPWT